MVRLLWLSGLVAALAQAQQLNYATVQFDTAPRVIENNNSTLSVVPDTLMDTSPLLDTTSRIQKRKAIDVAVKVATVVGGSTGIVLGGKAGIDIYEYIAQKIKTKSDLSPTGPTPTMGPSKAMPSKRQPPARTAIRLRSTRRSSTLSRNAPTTCTTPRL
jgi:hypothetical protein